ncbi:hypothetical protein ACFL0S_12250 [Thermodesulfobacteriota bacterium]
METAKSNEIKDNGTEEHQNVKATRGPAGSLRVGQKYNGYETIRILKRQDKQENQRYYQLRCSSCKSERLVRSDQLKRLSPCSCGGNTDEIVQALRTRYTLEDPRVHDFLRIYVLGKSKADAVILSGIINNPKTNPDHLMLVANHILTVPEIQKEHRRVKESNEIILLESTVEQLDVTIDKLHAAGDPASLRAAGSLLEKKSKLVMELHKENSKGFSADDVLDAMMERAKEPRPEELRELTSDGRCKHCGAEKKYQAE